MKCPVCKTPDLVMSDRQGVEIDYCPQCRGVWLDRGELDKILDRSRRELEPSAGPSHSAPAHPRKLDDSDIYPSPYASRHHKKKKHWLLEIFD